MSTICNTKKKKVGSVDTPQFAWLNPIFPDKKKVKAVVKPIKKIVKIKSIHDALTKPAQQEAPTKKVSEDTKSENSAKSMPSFLDEINSGSLPNKRNIDTLKKKSDTVDYIIQKFNLVME